MQRSTRVRGPESTCGVEKIHCNCVLYPSTLWLHLALNDCIAGWMMKRPEMYHYKSDHMAPQSCIRLEQKWHLLFVKRTGKDLLTFWRWGLYIWKEAINPTKLSRHFWEMLGLSMISLFFFFLSAQVKCILEWFLSFILTLDNSRRALWWGLSRRSSPQIEPSLFLGPLEARCRPITDLVTLWHPDASHIGAK